MLASSWMVRKGQDIWTPPHEVGHGGITLLVPGSNISHFWRHIHLLYQSWNQKIINLLPDNCATLISYYSFHPFNWINSEWIHWKSLCSKTHFYPVSLSELCAHWTNIKCGNTPIFVEYGHGDLKGNHLVSLLTTISSCVYNLPQAYMISNCRLEPMDWLTQD